MAMMNDHMPIATGARYKIEHSPPSVGFNFQLSLELDCKTFVTPFRDF